LDVGSANEWGCSYRPRLGAHYACLDTGCAYITVSTRGGVKILIQNCVRAECLASVVPQGTPHCHNVPHYLLLTGLVISANLNEYQEGNCELLHIQRNRNRFGSQTHLHQVRPTFRANSLWLLVQEDGWTD
jgi:hypothetical protein